MAAHTPLDYRRWFDRMQPQTLQIATFLLYFNAFFSIIDLLGDRGYLGGARVLWGWGFLLGLAVVASYILGGFLMANDRKVGYYLAIFAAFSPFILRFLVLNAIEDRNPFVSYSLWDKLTGNNLLSFIFEVALCALVLHPMSRSYAKTWYH